MLPSASIVSRRRVLAGAGAIVTCFSLRSGAQTTADLTPDGFRLLRARAGSPRRGPVAEAGAIPVWGFEGAVPGPLLRVTRGEELRLRLINELSDPAAIHWHGVRVPNLMDGAPGLTQTAVAPGAGFDYRFRPPDAGTFWYHAPWSTAVASDRRLYGALIVEEADPAEVDREHVLVFDEWPIVPPQAPPRTAVSFQILTNGRPAPDLAVRANERLRLRLINAATARVVALRLDRHIATVMAIDGQPSEPFRARDDRIVLGPGNTADLFIDATLEPGATAPILLAEADQETALARLVYDGAPPIRALRAPPRRLPANPLPERLDLIHALKPVWPIDLTMAPREQPTLRQQPLLREQPARFQVKRGRTVMLALTNRQASACAVHVHGHAFRLLDRLDDGWKPFWLATVLVEAGQTTRIAFLADNPGKWPIEWVGIGQSRSLAAGWFEVA